MCYAKDRPLSPTVGDPTRSEGILHRLSRQSLRYLEGLRTAVDGRASFVGFVQHHICRFQREVSIRHGSCFTAFGCGTPA
jgi:hypothetical protein